MLRFPSQVIQRQRSGKKRHTGFWDSLFLITYFSGISRVISCFILIEKNTHFYKMEFASFFSFSEKYTIFAINCLNCCLWHTIFRHTSQCTRLNGWRKHEEVCAVMFRFGGSWMTQYQLILCRSVALPRKYWES